MYQSKEVVIAAFDGMNKYDCRGLLVQSALRLYGVKIHDLWDGEGPEVVKFLKEVGCATKIWVDLKLKDIPTAVGLRAKRVREAGADILTVHASGGIEMMMAAVENGPAEIYAVTVLTSLDEEDTHLIHGNSAKATALYLARLAKLAGVHGVVCSPKEVGLLAARPELQGLKFVVPGVRSAGVDAVDQKRVDTPAAAIKAGATHLVVGRELTKARNPLVALDNLEQQIKQAIAGEKKESKS